MGKLRTFFLLTPCLLVTTLTSCTPPAGSSGFVKLTTAAANDHIMYVRQNPETFGHQRLTALARLYPDLGIFLHLQGTPDFLAETNKGGNRYLILYFLKPREAYACRSGLGKSRQVEFSGPYPVTDNEFKTLDDLRKKAENGS